MSHPPHTPPIDHRRAVADRNHDAILDAAEQLVAQRSALSMAAVAAEAGISRPTLYAHFRTLADVLEAAVRRSVERSVAAIDAAEPVTGAADAALLRVLDASWHQLAAFDAVTRGAAEHLPAGHLHRTHAPLLRRLVALVERGQTDGTFRDDLPADWLVHVYFSLVHGAHELAQRPRTRRTEVHALLRTTVLDLVRGPRADRTARS